jgi:beta-aspartyl-peptidase (threonine type)
MSEGRLDRVAFSWGADGGAWSVLVHGGAGSVPPERIGTHVEGCRAAARAAVEVLRAGGTAIDAVERAVIVMEDDPSFNAGTGSALNAEGGIELDASVMEGSRLRAGGVCALPPFLNPIAIARAVLEDGRHVLYAGEGAARFAVDHGFTPATLEAMVTENARARWLAARAAAGETGGAASGSGGTSGPASGSGGTVGAVARDARGGVAAATSTGGLVNKRAGRVGDSPVPGAGNYADDEAGACSATGQGEALMRVCAAKAAVDLLRAGVHPEEAARAIVRTLGARTAGTGGLVLVDRHGRLGLARNTPTMVWAGAGELSQLAAGD